MKKHDRNGQKNNLEVKKPVSDSEAKALESVAEAAEAAEAAGEAAEETAAKTAETAKEAAETVDLDIDAAAEDADVDVASLVNSVAQENVKASEVKAADGLPAELASALAEPRPEIKVEEAEIEEASDEEPAFEETVAEEAPAEETAVEEESAADVETEAVAADVETEAVEAVASDAAAASEEPAEAAEAADGKEKNEQAEEVVLLAKNKEDKTADEASEKDTSDEGAAETASEKTESEEAAEKAESEETLDPEEEAETGDEKKHEEENAKEKSALYMFLDTVKFVAIGLLIGILLVVFVIQRNDVYGSSMEPTLHTGDAVFVEMISVYTGNFDRGDIVTIDAKGMDGYTHEENLIKRIIGLPGETIKIDEGNVYINGVLLDESAYLPAGTKTFVGAEGQARGYQEITLGPDEYYCMGDNRGGSNDSRRMGPFKKSQIDAKVLARIYPFNKMRFF